MAFPEIDLLLDDALDRLRSLEPLPSEAEVKCSRADLAAALAAVSDVYLAITDELAAARGTYR